MGSLVLGTMFFRLRHRDWNAVAAVACVLCMLSLRIPTWNRRGPSTTMQTVGCAGSERGREREESSQSQEQQQIDNAKAIMRQKTQRTYFGETTDPPNCTNMTKAPEGTVSTLRNELYCRSGRAWQSADLGAPLLAGPDPEGGSSQVTRLSNIATGLEDVLPNLEKIVPASNLQR